MTDKRSTSTIMATAILLASLMLAASTSNAQATESGAIQWCQLAQQMESAANMAEFSRAEAGFVCLLAENVPAWQWKGAWGQGGYVLRFAAADSRNGIVDPSRFDAIVPASQLDYRNFRSHIVTEGRGVPAVALYVSTPERMAKDPLLSERGFPLAVTVVAEVSSAARQGRREIVVKVYDSALATCPVAADYTAPYSWLTDGGKRSSKIALAGLLHPEESLSKAGLFATQPYDPGRIPVVFIHGLDSAPITWLDLANEVRADPVIRQRYQFWVYRYPSGLPFGAAAALLRREFRQVQNYCDPKGDSANFNRMVLIGHSMGGLVTHMMVVDSGDTLWNAFFDTPPDQLKLNSNEKAMLKEILFFKHQPFVKRAVFISTPHRGSRFATNKLGRLGSKLIKTPGQLLDLTQNLTQSDPDAFSDLAERVDLRMPTSIDSLRPDNPTLKVLECMPIVVPFHSIMGDRGYGALGNESDGVVRYWSSHLDGAQSELIVPSPHSAQENPMTIREIDRILRVHLRSVGR